MLWGNVNSFCDWLYMLINAERKVIAQQILVCGHKIQRKTWTLSTGTVCKDSKSALEDVRCINVCVCSFIV